MAEPIGINDLPASYLFSSPSFIIVKHLAQYSLASDIRKDYYSAIDSFESFCIL